jgi:hypothetical protein
VLAVPGESSERVRSTRSRSFDFARPPSADDLAPVLRYALRYQGRKRVHSTDFAEFVAKRPLEHLERAGSVVMKQPADVGAAALGRGYEA